MERTPQDRARHPMGVVAERTGLTPHVLRAWERRYGAVRPGRTEGGQRLYTDADVVRLRLLKRATETGRPIGTVADLTTEALAALVGEDAEATAGGSRLPVAGESASRDRHLAEALEAADRLDGSGLRAVLFRAVVQLSAPVFATQVVAPLLERVGALWEAGRMRPAQEHVVSAAVRQILDWLLGRYDAPATAPLVVAGTPSGELHEFGAMLAAVLAADAGWRVLYLGPSLPPEEVLEATRRTGALAVAVSVVNGEEADRGRAGRELAALRDGLPEGVLLVAGGRRAAEVAPEGVMVVTRLESLREVLESARPLRAAGEA